MKPIAKTLMFLMVLSALPIMALAQADRFGATDTVFADVAKIDNGTWTVTISYFNDQDVVGLAIPFKMDAGTNRIVADSAVYTGGRIAAAEWTYPGFRPDTAIQCVTLGMMANIGPTDHKLTTGSGRLVTVFVSSLEDKAIESLTIDTTRTEPGNRLMSVLGRVQGTPPDTVLVELADRTFTPAWVVRYAK
jgi:hypothetical protein